LAAQRRARDAAAAAARGPGAYDTAAAFALAVRRRVATPTLTGRPPSLFQAPRERNDADAAPSAAGPDESARRDEEVPPALELPDALAEPKAVGQGSQRGDKGAASDEEAKPTDQAPAPRPDDYSPSGKKRAKLDFSFNNFRQTKKK
jgi:hypothetical protein